MKILEAAATRGTSIKLKLGGDNYKIIKYDRFQSNDK
jgi:hypothetical protein